MTAVATSDHLPRPNIRSGEEWLHAVIYSGQVTRVAQHLALLLYHIADPATGSTKRSVRELEQLTGWSRETIADRLSELEVFMRVTLGRGRAKTEFELQCAITAHVQDQRRRVVEVAQPDTTDSETASAADEEAAVEVDEADATAAACVVLRMPSTFADAELAAQLDAVADATADTSDASGSAMATADAIPDAREIVAVPVAKTDAAADTSVAVAVPDAISLVAVDLPDATPPSRAHPRATKESPSEIVISTDSLSRAEQEGSDAESENGVRVNGVAIYGPGFKLSFAAIDLAAGMIGMPADRARTIATICAHDWADNKRKPDNPMAVVKKAMKADQNDAAIHDVRMAKAKTGSARASDSQAEQPSNERVERMKRRAAEQLAKQQKGNTP